MDHRERTGESDVVRLPLSQGNVTKRQVRQRPETSTPIRKAWATLVRVIRSAGEVIRLITFISLMVVTLPFRNWKGIFILSCVAVSLDPLFLYIPIIDAKNKCLGMDKSLRNVALVFRSLTDFAFISHILRLIFSQMDDVSKWDDSNSDSAQLSWSSVIIINCLAILPIPQVAILVAFFKMEGSEHFLKQTIINVFLLFQFLLRLFQMYLSSKEVVNVGKWAKGSFYFFLYILASHVLAAFWYFFSIQRERACWYQTCRNIAGCLPNYKCGHSISLNSTILNELCPINSPNATIFDFGMYLDILKSGNTGSIDFPTKFFYSFGWGLRNLSNFGTNLQTSSYVWENCFAILICAIGLLSFLYFIGNVQTYIQSETEKLVKIEDSRRMRIKAKSRDIEEWMTRHGLTDDTKKAIRDTIKEDALVKSINDNVDITFILKVTEFFDWTKNKEIAKIFYEQQLKNVHTLQNRRHLGMIALKKVPLLKNLHEYVLEIICNHLELVRYDEDTCLVEAGKPLGFMIFVLGGKIKLTAATTCSSHINESCADKILDEGGFYGEQLLSWASPNNISFSDHPVISTHDVKCETHVEALILKAEDLRSAVSKCGSKWNFSQQLVDGDRDSVSDPGASASTNNEQTIQLHRGHDMLLEQLVLIRETIFHLRDDMGRRLNDQRQRLDNQGRILDEMAAFLARLGYTGTSSPPPSP